jgi:hypothetical protein
MNAEAMRLIQAFGSLPGGPDGKASGHLGRPRSVRRDASRVQICATFASVRTARLLCVAPLDMVPGAFSARADANGRSSSACVAPLEMKSLGPAVTAW